MSATLIAASLVETAMLTVLIQYDSTSGSFVTLHLCGNVAKSLGMGIQVLLLE